MTVAVGASGAIMGLIGMAATFAWRAGSALPPRRSPSISCSCSGWGCRCRPEGSAWSTTRRISAAFAPGSVIGLVRVAVRGRLRAGWTRRRSFYRSRLSAVAFAIVLLQGGWADLRRGSGCRSCITLEDDADRKRQSGQRRTTSYLRAGERGGGRGEGSARDDRIQGVEPAPHQRAGGDCGARRANLESERQAFGRLMTLEMGKLLGAAADEAVKCATACRYYAERGREFHAAGGRRRALRPIETRSASSRSAWCWR